ncbi:UDP-N-acetylmuramoyl-L-alanyl-D-glutamate--2,6-diaminopimelate ligase [Thermovenabulum gondwanense]|uniref:UDP-N-acetylmuramoyl-L-alanyl-D-glutamate--2,6-diaminopimelate ligase n=1 Tax=Thermovenabulum gondwanense TaxID=520767 RepID=A0A161PUY7_9FIRM|nr:UDP-N-acetylmuramoyl-L-alanyl-D-glutamate--2,6-diaminopimelate ligase [Thermovenabulum gondwanense]KYO66676.1 UDP-N-acetylmuramoyl-L-alanyl-D-glutamate--2,6-diaminopimelate ligase [Thermovenabulum gondwanense]
MIKGHELIEILKEVKKVSGNINVTIEDIQYDSRKIKKNSLFVAITGFKDDGHKYINDAIINGACAVISEREVEIKQEEILYIVVENSRKALSTVSDYFYESPSKNMKIVGVTGTNGKTTTTYLIKEIFQNAGLNAGVIGTLGIFVNGVLFPSERTTPESLELHKTFYEMRKNGIEYVSMEVSSHSLKLSRVDDISFEVGVFTNLTQDHLDFHPDFEDYYLSKRKLFSLSKKAAINADDFHGNRLMNEIKIPSISYAIENDADVKANNVKISEDGVSYDLIYRGEKININYQVPGKFSVYNSLAAISAALLLGIDLNTSAKAISKVKGVPGRFEPIKEGQNFSVIVDYAHTPDGLENVLNTIKSFAKGRIITVFGAGGDRDKTKRPKMGKIVSELSDYFIITSDNPRTEDPVKIIEDIEAGVDPAKSYEKIVDRREAIKKAIEIAQKDDVILIAGKGHENYQIIKDRIIPFDDREVAREFLKARGEK